MIRHVFLDLDNTLMDFTGGEAAALRLTLRDMGVTPTDEMAHRYRDINLHHWQLLEQGLLTRPQVVVQRFDAFFREFALPCSGLEASRIYEAHLSAQHELLPGATELLKTLYPRYRLYLASNGTKPVQNRRLADADLYRWFQGIFLSQDLGADKPSELFFHQAFAAIEGFDSREAIIVGDSLTSDILGGRNAGILTCWFNPHKNTPQPDIVPHYEISSLAQLPPLLETL